MDGTLAISSIDIGVWRLDVEFVTSASRMVVNQTMFCSRIVCISFYLACCYKQQMQGVFKYTSQQLRIWNEVATIFLVAIVVAPVVSKTEYGVVWGLTGLILLVMALMSAIKIYKIVRAKDKNNEGFFSAYLLLEEPMILWNKIGKSIPHLGKIR